MENTNDHLIETAIRGFIATDLLYSEEGFTHGDDVSLLRERIIDSLGVVELAAFLVRRFGVRVEQSEVRPENFDSVARLAAFVRRKQGAARPESARPEAVPQA
ncbi:MAG: acyl carrier protein [Elusimicrobiota bacterium]|nr:acyl carrier protein [Elusimicrobiota bacterium]